MEKDVDTNTFTRSHIEHGAVLGALRTRVLDEIRNVDGQIFFGGEGDLLPHAAEQRTVSLYHQGINRQPAVSSSQNNRRAAPEHDDHQYERVQSSMSHGAGTRHPLFKSTVSPSTSRSRCPRAILDDENSKTLTARRNFRTVEINYRKRAKGLKDDRSPNDHGHRAVGPEEAGAGSQCAFFVHQGFGTVFGSGPTDVDLARVQQQAYIDALEANGVRVHRLDADENHPDCMFVEDQAVVVDGHMLFRPGHPRGSPSNHPLLSS